MVISAKLILVNLIFKLDWAVYIILAGKPSKDPCHSDYIYFIPVAKHIPIEFYRFRNFQYDEGAKIGFKPFQILH